MKPRLLQRISQWEQAALLDDGDSEALSDVEMIRQDLEKIYNTRKGTVLIDDDFGLPDFSAMLNGYSAPDVNVIVQQLYFQARRYEPRLSGVQVKFVEQDRHPGQLEFHINGVLTEGEQKSSISLNALLCDDGSVNLST